MSELRAPDPTLTAHMASSWPYVYIIRTPDSPIPAAHREGGCSLAWHSTDNACDARWYAVPCALCFPDAPPPGLSPCIRSGCPEPAHPATHLSWQVPS